MDASGTIARSTGRSRKSNAEWWRRKIRQNVERDQDTNERLRDLGWRVIRIWEHEDHAEAADRIAEAYHEALAGHCGTNDSTDEEFPHGAPLPRCKPVLQSSSVGDVRSTRRTSACEAEFPRSGTPPCVLGPSLPWRRHRHPWSSLSIPEAMVAMDRTTLHALRMNTDHFIGVDGEEA